MLKVYGILKDFLSVNSQLSTITNGVLKKLAAGAHFLYPVDALFQATVCTFYCIF